MARRERFWRLRKPAYESDYQDISINGSAVHRLGLPGVRCVTCGQTWSGIRILSVACPPELQAIPELADPAPIPDEAHRVLRERVQAALHAAGHPIDRLLSGDRFVPAAVTFPAHPIHDFAWSSLGGPIVAACVKELFERHRVTGVTFVPAVIERIGRRSPDVPPPIPRSGEPEDLLNFRHHERHPDRFGPLYELIVTAESGRPHGAEVIRRCPACGREDYDKERRLLILTEGIIPEADVFMLATTLWIIVTQRVRDLIVEHRLTNVHLTEMEVFERGWT